MDINKAQTYTIAELQAMPNDALNALAAELRGWTLAEDEYPEELAPMRKSKTIPVWLDHGDFTGLAPESLSGYVYKFTPATDRNQSGELLEALKTKNVHGAIRISLTIPTGVRIELSKPQKTVYAPGWGPHAETAAFCAAMLAMAGRLK